MRTLIRITPDVDKGNAAVTGGNLGRIIQQTMEKLHPEAAYFFADGGRRTATFVCDLADQADIPMIAEPWFLELNAKVEFFPCMNAEDLKRGLDKVAASKEYAATP